MSDNSQWDDQADVVVVGFGGAGGAAALQARQLGADVLVIDRFGGGGATAYSGGVIYAGGTAQQREAGYEDTPENMFEWIRHPRSVDEKTAKPALKAAPQSAATTKILLAR